MDEFAELFGMDLEKLAAERSNAISVGIHVDVAVRLAIIAAGKVLSPAEVDQLFEGIQSELLDQYENNERIIALEHYQKLWNRVSTLSKAIHKDQ